MYFTNTLYVVHAPLVKLSKLFLLRVPLLARELARAKNLSGCEHLLNYKMPTFFTFSTSFDCGSDMPWTKRKFCGFG